VLAFPLGGRTGKFGDGDFGLNRGDLNMGSFGDGEIGDLDGVLNMGSFGLNTEHGEIWT